MGIEELLAREAIRHTIACYNIAGDRARADEYAEAFAEDGILDAGSKVLEGREAIRNWMKGWGRSSANTTTMTRAKFVRHNITTSKIDLIGADVAQARTYYFVITDIGPDHSGYYVDQFRKVGDRWLIAHRRAMVDWKAVGSTFAGGASASSASL